MFLLMVCDSKLYYFLHCPSSSVVSNTVIQKVYQWQWTGINFHCELSLLITKIISYNQMNNVRVMTDVCKKYIILTLVHLLVLFYELFINAWTWITLRSFIACLIWQTLISKNYLTPLRRLRMLDMIWYLIVIVSSSQLYVIYRNNLSCC
jgi:hypothetical protein